MNCSDCKYYEHCKEKHFDDVCDYYEKESEE